MKSKIHSAVSVKYFSELILLSAIYLFRDLIGKSAELLMHDFLVRYDQPKVPSTLIYDTLSHDGSFRPKLARAVTIHHFHIGHDVDVDCTALRYAVIIKMFLVE